MNLRKTITTNERIYLSSHPWNCCVVHTVCAVCSLNISLVCSKKWVNATTSWCRSFDVCNIVVDTIIQSIQWIFSIQTRKSIDRSLWSHFSVVFLILKILHLRFSSCSVEQMARRQVIHWTIHHWIDSICIGMGQSLQARNWVLLKEKVKVIAFLKRPKVNEALRWIELA